MIGIYVSVVGKNVGLVFGYQDFLTIAVKGLKCGHKGTDATNHPIHASATAGVGNETLQSQVL